MQQRSILSVGVLTEMSQDQGQTCVCSYLHLRGKLLFTFVWDTFFGQYLSFVTLSHSQIVQLASFIHKLSIDVWFVRIGQYLTEKITFKVVQMFKSSY